MSQDDVERVARAIFSEDGPHTHPWEMQHPYRANEFRTMARAAIAALPPQDGWQDIATAPKANIVDGDGPRILATWDKHSGHITIVRHGRCPANDGITWFTDSGLPCGSAPTHWQPLPAPPAAEIERALAGDAP